ncbi:MAG: hypothetical protein JNL74_02285, partial [Fibrobacteres bacterium]|nr:hypothetical protein [Fibrobacterota bacterium]
MIKLLVCLLLGFWSYAESAITAVNQRDTLTENTRSSVNLMTSDDSTFYMYHIISAPKNGVLTKSLTIMKSGDSARGNWFYYTANPGFTADSFTWTATNNGGTVSNVATFRIKIVPNRTPTVIRGKVAITYRDKIQPFPVTFADPDQAQTYTITILSQPSHGVISAIGGSKPIFRFTPDQNSQLFVGVDSFSWKISDGFSES